ncbi:hypothetical protein MRB53_003270 [Persea americana]|uniref:Uncharacterized protein n=1 Tax=Persea americana TaxID=3435 RepID=A0ACC2MWR0_PERAE|nr:hypothetical protein MRB53_003270 [Persea americana]
MPPVCQHASRPFPKPKPSADTQLPVPSFPGQPLIPLLSKHLSLNPEPQPGGLSSNPPYPASTSNPLSPALPSSLSLVKPPPPAQATPPPGITLSFYYFVTIWIVFFKSLGQDESIWPSETPVWIWLRGIPYHCWNNDIVLSIIASIGRPLPLDDTTAKQRMLSFARVQVLLDVARSSPRLLTVALEGEESVNVEVQYESIPCSECPSAGHLSTKCPFKLKPRLLKTPAQDAVPTAPTTIEDPRKDKGANH